MAWVRLGFFDNVNRLGIASAIPAEMRGTMQNSYVIFDTLAQVLDTHIACRNSGRKPSLRYICGEGAPNYPVPAIPIEVEYDVHSTSYFLATWKGDDCSRCWYKPL